MLARLPGCALQVPLTKDRPSEAKYFTRPRTQRERFTADAMPVIAYLDAGIYCHPIVDGLVEAVKIGYYNPPDMPRGTHEHRQHRRASSSSACPGWRDAEIRDVEDVDQCDYDLVADDDFVLGAIPGVANAFVGVGWRGTGYKFAPWVGRVLAELALRRRHRTRHRPLRPGEIPEGGLGWTVRHSGPCSSASLTASSSAPRATSSSSSAAATSRRARSSPR